MSFQSLKAHLYEVEADDWGQGDVLRITVFSWHQYSNTGAESAGFRIHHNRRLMETLGFVPVKHGESNDE
jgi:hypothetical protein